MIAYSQNVPTIAMPRKTSHICSSVTFLAHTLGRLFKLNTGMYLHCFSTIYSYVLYGIYHSIIVLCSDDLNLHETLPLLDLARCMAGFDRC